MLRTLKAVLKNRVIWYLLTRYITYFIQFITSIFIAVKLGAYYWGIWGFILLVLNYFQVINFGISNALNVFLVQFKDNRIYQNKYIASSIVSVGTICVIAFFLVGCYYWGNLTCLDKYEFSDYGYWVVIIAILAYYNNLFMVIYRVKNSLFEISFYQSIIPLLLAMILLFGSGRTLLYLFLYSYIVGNAISAIIFLLRGRITPLFKGMESKFFIDIWRKGFYLLAHAILLLLEAFSFIIFPKVMARLNEENPEKVMAVIDKLRVNYIGISHGLIYLAMPCFPLLFMLFPQYQESLYVLNFISLTLLMRVNSFGFSSYLVVKNRDKEIARISLFTLIVNVGIALFLANWIELGYEYIIFSTMFAYMLYSYFCVSYSIPLLNKRMSIQQKLFLCFPLKTFIPYVVALIVSFAHISALLILPLFIYVILNKNDIKEMVVSVRRLVYKPEMVDV